LEYSGPESIRPQIPCTLSGAALSRHQKVQAVSLLADIVVLDAIIRISDASAIGFVEVLHGRTLSGPSSPLWQIPCTLSGAALSRHQKVQIVSRLANIVVLDAIIRISDTSAIGFVEILLGHTLSGPSSPLWLQSHIALAKVSKVTSMCTALKQHDLVSEGHGAK
jgi:hypothetical protein